MLGALPLLAGLLPDKVAPYFFPPLDAIFVTVAVLLCVVVTIVIYFAAPLPFSTSARRRMRALMWCVGIAIVGALLLIATVTRFVRFIDVPAKGTQIGVTVGFVRSDLAQQTFANKSDWEVLEARGTTEEEIQWIWKPWSITLARILLFSTYLLCLLSLVSAGSFAVLFECLGPPTTP
jgi:hypothetical protein